MYGSARARVFYGAGDYNRAVAMTRGYYQAGGFFDLIKKGIGAVSKVAASPLGGIAGKLLKGIPVLGTALSLGSAAGSLIGGLLPKPKGIEVGPTFQSVKQLQGQGLLPAAKGFDMRLERGSPRRKRRSKSKRRAPARRRSRRRARGDYGDDWRGDNPSRDTRGRYLTRAGGRRRKRRSSGRKRGQRVSFTTKTGKRVSFTAKGDGGELQ